MERGYPAREVAHVLILKSLLEQDMGFEELVNRLNGQLSRGTVNKYLNEIYESEDEFKDFVKRKGRRGAYYIPEEKRGEVELFLKREETKRDCNFLIDNATSEEIEELRKDFRELKKLTYPVYAKLEAELFRIKYEASAYRSLLAMLKKGRWKPLSIFWKGELQKLSGTAEKQVAELEPQVVRLRKFFDSEEAQQARNQVLLEEIRQLAHDTKGEKWRKAVYANWLAELERQEEAQEKREQERG